MEIGKPPRAGPLRARPAAGLAVRPAWGAEVVSSNIVGYNKVNLNRGYNMLAVQFQKVGGAAKSIQDVFIGNLPDMEVDGDGFPVWNAKFQTWNGGGYDDYFWTGSVGGTLFGDEAYNNVWVIGEYGDGGVADVSPATGEGIFLWTSGNNVTVTQSGEVATNATKEVTLSSGYNLVCNPYPEAITIQDIEFTGLPDMEVDGDGFPVWNAKFQTWNGGGYDDYFWTGSVGGTLFGDEAYNNVWVIGEYGDGGIADASVGVGDAFFVWVRSANNTKIIFTK